MRNYEVKENNDMITIKFHTHTINIHHPSKLQREDIYNKIKEYNHFKDIRMYLVKTPYCIEERR